MNLKAGGGDASDLIRRWNAQASKEGQLAGQKRTAVMQVLEFEAEVVDEIIETVNECGWEKCPYSDENLGSPKWKAGSSLRTKSKVWNVLSKASGDSRVLAVDHLRTTFQSKIPAMRIKLPKAGLEEILTMSAMVTNLINEVKTLYPIPDQILLKKLKETMEP